MRRALPLVACILLSAALQTAAFPIAGPLPPVRAQLAWFALSPWLYVVFQQSSSSRRPLLRATIWSYFCGVLWYAGHCYWIFETMHLYGNLSSGMAAVVLVLFCLYLGLYHACFGLVAAVLWRSFRHRLHPVLLGLLLASAWTAVELARARITSFPWDLLGYSQIDNAALTALAPLAGVYAISFLLAYTNAGFALALFQATSRQSETFQRPAPVRSGRQAFALVVACGIVTLSASAGWIYHAPTPTATSQAIAVQPNLEPSAQSTPTSTPLESQLAALTLLQLQQSHAPAPALILWPEAPTPYELHEPLFQSTLKDLAARSWATVLADSNAVDVASAQARHSRSYNAAGLFTSGGLRGRYNKIHLVPFGEFVPYADLFQFAGGLTEQVGSFDRGTQRAPMTDGQHSYGVFICYESIFPEEVRQLVQRGAEVFVNLSDDGWYGDTSAPFQHSNMARMRAIENRRWLLRDTNTGITESIDPYGNVRAAALRHQRLAAPLPYAYQSDLTFYTQHGDILAWLCAALTLAATASGLAQRQDDLLTR